MAHSYLIDVGKTHHKTDPDILRVLYACINFVSDISFGFFDGHQDVVA